MATRKGKEARGENVNEKVKIRVEMEGLAEIENGAP